jgi:hypothetical protein
MDVTDQQGLKDPRKRAEQTAVKLRLIQEVGRAARRRRAAAQQAPSTAVERAAFLARKAAVYDALGRADLAREARSAASHAETRH